MTSGPMEVMLRKTDEGVFYRDGEVWRPAVCEWFARCGRAATSTQPHPVLGAVPICARCQRKVGPAG